MKKREHGEAISVLLHFFLLFTFFLCIIILLIAKIQETEQDNVQQTMYQDLSLKIKNELQEEQLNTKKIALTFDDGPHPVYTLQLLEGLKKRNVKASFFVLGESAEEHPDIIKQMNEDGHLIGNHTYHHLQLTKQNKDVFIDELKATNEVIEEITGKSVEYVRPPYGSWDKKFEEQLNMFPVLWTIDPLDWCSSDSSCVTQKVVGNATDGGIILLHDTFKTSVTAALQIVDILQQQGYEFVTVDQILFD